MAQINYRPVHLELCLTFKEDSHAHTPHLQAASGFSIVPFLDTWAIYAANHHRQETLGKLTGDPTRLQMIKKMVRDEFAKTFGCRCCGD